MKVPIHKLYRLRQFVISTVLVLGSAHLVLAQGSFFNLDFEASRVPPSQPTGAVPVDEALPGWDAYIGTMVLSEVGYNSVSLGSPNVSLIGPNAAGAERIEGTFSVLLQAGAIGPTAFSASIAQTGTIPEITRFIQFKAMLSPGNLLVTVAGEQISLTPVLVQPDYTLFTADIARFAGQAAELKISTLSTASQPFTHVNIDSIEFVVPEPGLVSFLLLGGLMLAVCRSVVRRRNDSRSIQ